MFHNIKLDPIEFRSNPPIEPQVTRKLAVREDGSPYDVIEKVPVDNKSFLAGAHYDAASMSLSARLRLGIPLQQVNIGITENDPNVLYRSVNRFANELESRLYARNAAEAAKAAAESTIDAPSVES